MEMWCADDIAGIGLGHPLGESMIQLPRVDGGLSPVETEPPQIRLLLLCVVVVLLCVLAVLMCVVVCCFTVSLSL